MRNYHCLSMAFLLLIPVLSYTTEKPPILYATLQTKRYCDTGSSREMALMVRFKNRLTNTGAIAIVVTDREYPLVFVSKTLGDLHSGKHEFELHAPDVFPQPFPRDSSQKATEPKRHIVKPGETFEFDTMDVTIPIAKTAKVSKDSALPSGTHYLELVMDLNAEGTTTFVRAVSQPVKLVVEKYPRTQKCR